MNESEPGKFYRSISLVCGALLLAIGVTLAACGNSPIKNSTPAQTRNVIDGRGRAVTIPKNVYRAVSLAPNLTEIIFAVGAGDKLVGVTTFCNYPPEAAKIQKVSDTQTPNIESVIALKPQVVFVTTASQLERFAQTLTEQGIAVYVTDPSSLADVGKSILGVGETLNATEKARAVADGLKKRALDVEAKTAAANRPRVFVQIDNESLYTIGKDSFITDVLTKAGAVSVTENVQKAYFQLSKETALAANPDVIILSNSENNRDPNSVFDNSAAVKNGKVFRIDADLLSRPGPRLVDALEQIARYLHPESFK